MMNAKCSHLGCGNEATVGGGCRLHPHFAQKPGLLTEDKENGVTWTNLGPPSWPTTIGATIYDNGV